MRLPPGRYGLLISTRCTPKARTGLLAFLPDVVATTARFFEELAIPGPLASEFAAQSWAAPSGGAVGS
jgi:hypothetical protein